MRLGPLQEFVLMMAAQQYFKWRINLQGKKAAFSNKNDSLWDFTKGRCCDPVGMQRAPACATGSLPATAQA